MGAQLRRAKILSTVGPVSGDPDTLRALVEAGSDAIRINFAHASHEQAAPIIAQLRDLARETGRAIGVHRRASAIASCRRDRLRRVTRRVRNEPFR
jgi:pyruvate kinase